MTELTEEEIIKRDERAELLSRAALLGITVHPNAKDETIAAKIAAKLAEGSDTAPVAAPAPVKELHPAKRLRRCIITCNDPQKADQTGDIISVSNAEVGNMRFYFHFNKPWHVPEIIYQTIKEARLFLHSSRRDGREIITREVARYNVQDLPPLDEKQRERIAAKQAAALASED